MWRVSKRIMMKITRRNAVLCVLWAVFVVSLPIYVFWAIFNWSHLRAWEAKFCGFIDKQIIKKQKQCRQRKMNNYCKKCRLRDGCIRKCKEAEIYEQGYNDSVEDFKTKSNGIQRKDT